MGKTVEWLDTATPVQWLQQEEFERLEQHLNTLYEEVKAHPEQEYRLLWTYYALTNSYMSTYPHVLAWHTKQPQSHNARILEGAQTIHKAWHIRGSGSAYTVSEKNALRFYAGLAETAEILAPVLEALPDHPAVWHYYVTSQCAHKTASCPEEVATMLDENVPHAYFARSRLMNFIQPKWGGSMEMLRAYQQKMAPKIADNPHWKPLLGFDQLVLCETYRRRGNLNFSLIGCEKAWSYGPDPEYLEIMAPTYIGLNRFELLSEHVKELKARFPSDFYDYKLDDIAERIAISGRDMAWAVYSQSETETSPADTAALASAMEAFAVAIDISPREPNAYIERAYVHTRQKNPDEAEKDLRLAISVNPDAIRSYEELTTLIENRRAGMFGRKDYRDSDADLLTLWVDYTKRHPGNAQAHYMTALQYQRFGGDAEAARRHLETACKKDYKAACPHF